MPKQTKPEESKATLVIGVALLILAMCVVAFALLHADRERQAVVAKDAEIAAGPESPQAGKQPSCESASDCASRPANPANSPQGRDAQGVPQHTSSNVPAMAATSRSNDVPPVANMRCEFPGLDLPGNSVIYATGAYAGRKLPFQIDSSNHAATQIDVIVNRPDVPVVLMLGAYEPTVWNVRWTPQTQIVAAFVTGYHRQVVTGLPKEVPTLISSRENGGVC